MGDISPLHDSGPAVARRTALRGLGRLAAGGAGLAVGAALLRGEPAAATTGNFQFGAPNNAGADSTSLVGSAVDVFTVTASTFAATAIKGVGTEGTGVHGHTDATGNGVLATSSNDTAALAATNSGTGPAATFVAGSSDPTVTVIGSQAGHAITVDNTVGSGLSVVATGTAIFAESSGDGAGLAATSLGPTAAVSAWATNSGPALEANSQSTAAAIRVVSTNTASANAVTILTDGFGSGVRSFANHGRGAELKGAKAALRLVPNATTTHPTTGSRGDMYVDRSGRLWYCRGGSKWVQLA